MLFVCGLLFLPRTGTTEIRNLPLLLFILTLILIFILIHFIKYVLLVAKTQKQLKKIGIQNIKIKIFPWASFFHGHYSITFPHEDKILQIILLSRKRKYQRYHFDSVNKIEFYRSNRVVFNNIKAKGATISNLVETNLVGKQRLKWDDAAEVRIIIFDKLPKQITDCMKKENIGTGEQICASHMYLLDLSTFCDYMKK
jgi:hypothetical protein